MRRRLRPCSIGFWQARQKKLEVPSKSGLTWLQSVMTSTRLTGGGSRFCEKLVERSWRYRTQGSETTGVVQLGVLSSLENAGLVCSVYSIS